jgi:hypothetical protein
MIKKQKKGKGNSKGITKKLKNKINSKGLFHLRKKSKECSIPLITTLFRINDSALNRGFCKYVNIFIDVVTQTRTIHYIINVTLKCRKGFSNPLFKTKFERYPMIEKSWNATTSSSSDDGDPSIHFTISNADENDKSSLFGWNANSTTSNLCLATDFDYQLIINFPEFESLNFMDARVKMKCMFEGGKVKLRTIRTRTPTNTKAKQETHLIIPKSLSLSNSHIVISELSSKYKSPPYHNDDDSENDKEKSQNMMDFRTLQEANYFNLILSDEEEQNIQPVNNNVLDISNVLDFDQFMNDYIDV